MALTAAQKKLRLEIKRANTRLSRLRAAGINSPAAERALSAIGQDNFNLGKKPTLSKEMAIKRAVEKFLKAKTSTVSGYREYMENRTKGILQYFKDIGTIATPEQIESTLTGSKTFSHYAEIYSVSSDEIAIEFSRGADSGKSAAEVEQELVKKFVVNPEIEAVEAEEPEEPEEE